MKRLSALLVLVSCASADTGVLIPGDRQQPDPAVFSLNELSLDIRIDNGVARVWVRQIFGNHDGSVHEGVYQFALPGKATVSDFAVWDDVTRIPGVILERRRAGEIYAQAKAQTIDPGLLEMGERSAGESGSPAEPSQEFTARIVPNPSFGTKRLEMEYQHPVPVERYQSEFVVPLKPDVYGFQRAGFLAITLELRSAHAIQDFEALAKTYPLRIRERTPSLIKADFFAYNVDLKEDFAVRYKLDPAGADSLRVIAERESLTGPGFFQAQTLLGIPASPADDKVRSAAPRTLILLFDNSLSMQWDKLERSFAACETALRGLHPADRFNLLLFNSGLSLFSPQPRPATTANIEQALTFVRNSRIRGGTDLQGALTAALAQTTAGEPYLMLITDAGATEGAINNGKLAAWYAAEWRKAAPAKRLHTLVFGVGDDANVPLLQMLAANNGYFDWVRSTEPIDFKLNAFLGKIGREPVKNLSLEVTPAANVDLVYPLEDLRFAGSMATWAGEYKRPVPQATFTIGGTRDQQDLRVSGTVELPVASVEHPELPRTWAKARVDALLEKIERQGEDRVSIDEIIRLSKNTNSSHPTPPLPGRAAGAVAASRHPAGRSGASPENRPFHRVGDRAVSVRPDQVAPLPEGRRYLADTVPRAGGHGRWHLPGPSDPSGPRWPHVSRNKEFRDRQQDARFALTPGENKSPRRRNTGDFNAGFCKRPHHHGSALRGASSGAALEQHGESQLRRAFRARQPATR